MESALLDTDTLSEIMKGIDPHVQDNARRYLAIFRHLTFSIITRDEMLRGLKARRATRQIARFEQRCQHSQVLPLTDDIIVQAAEVYTLLYQEGQPISDADILIAATALTHHLGLVTENVNHFRRIPGLSIESWRGWGRQRVMRGFQTHSDRQRAKEGPDHRHLRHIFCG